MAERIAKIRPLTIIKYLGLFVLSIVYLLIFSLWTTPLYKDWYGCDASFFTMAGRGILKGWVPYRDFFDLKGPYFFFIEALGQLFAKGRLGAFIIQVPFLFFSLILIYKLSKLFINTKKSLFIMLIFLGGHIATLWGGNTFEEYALPLNLLCLYLIARDYVKSKYYKINWYTSLIIGICFGIILFSKITVAAPIAGIVITSVIILIRNKDFRGLCLFLLYSVLGILLAALPVFIYFGINNCISEMLYSVFIFAFKRSIDYGTTFNIRWELKISGCYFVIIFCICQLINTDIKNKLRLFFKTKINTDCENVLSEESTNIPVNTRKNPNFEMLLIALFMAIATALVLHLGDPFIYYFTTCYPSVLFALILMGAIFDPFTLFRTWRLDIPLVAFLLTVCYFASWSASTMDTVIYDRKNTYYGEYVRQAKEMASLIPSYEKDDVFSFNMDMQWFECNQILPCYKYQINLQFFVALDNNIETEIISYLKETPPKWLVIGGDLSSYLPNINDVVTAKYQNVYENSYGALYLLQ